MLSNLKKLKLDELSDIIFDVYAGMSGRLENKKILVIKYSGFYRFGSFGDDDAAYMLAMGRASIAAWKPSAVILDWSNLRYHWGEQIKQVLEVGKDQCRGTCLPTAVIVGPNCEESLRLLLLGVYSKEKIDTLTWIFRDMKKAWNYVEERLSKVYEDFYLNG